MVRNSIATLGTRIFCTTSMATSFSHNLINISTFLYVKSPCGVTFNRTTSIGSRSEIYSRTDRWTISAVVDECGLVSSVVGVDVFDGEVVGGEVLLGHSQLGDQDVVALLIE